MCPGVFFVFKKRITLNHPNQFLFLRFIAFFISFVSLISCKSHTSENAEEKTLFTLLSPDSTGLIFTNQIHETAIANVLSYQYFYNGGGVAVGDINNDGLEDLFFTANQQTNKLFLNQGRLKFKDITLATGVGGRDGGWTTGAAIVDINSDGLKDIYVCYSGNLKESLRKNQLFVNQGLDRQGIPYFKEMAEEFGLADAGYSVASYFSDFDKDGDLDMLLLNHNPSLFTNLNAQAFKAMLQEYDPMSSSKIYWNEDGEFRDVSREVGLSGSPLSYGLGAIISDFNQDGWPDIYLGNDYSSPDYFYVNQGDGTFRNELEQSFSINSHYTMGVDAADFNQDGWSDLISLDMLPASNRRQKLLHSPENYEHYQLFVRAGLHHQVMRNMLQLNSQNGSFSEIGNLSGIEATDWSWAPLAADFDNDGRSDLFISNGFLKDFTNLDFINYRNTQLGNTHVTTETIQDLIQKMPATKVGNFAFKNMNGIQFEDVSKQWGVAIPSNSNGAVYADLDLDGDLDLVVNNLNEPSQIFENTSSMGENDFLQIQLEGPQGNPSGIGAKVWLFSKGKLQYQEQMIYKGYQGNVSEILHFGLGKRPLDSIKILWPDGKTQLIDKLESNQLIKVNHGNSVPLEYTRSEDKPLWELVDEYNISKVNSSIEDFKSQNQLLYARSNSKIHFAKGNLTSGEHEDLIFSDGEGNVWLMEKGNQSFQNKRILISGINGRVTDLVLVDLDSDEKLDLLVSTEGESGGGIYFQGNNLGFEKVELPNDGSGNYYSNVIPWDFDRDGDLDLVFAGSYILARWPESSHTRVFENVGNRKFQLRSSPLFDEIKRVNNLMLWDQNGDEIEELWIASEFEPIRALQFQSGKFSWAQTNLPVQSRGLWRNMILTKNKEGNDLLFLGNWGMNSRLEADSSNPLSLYFADFDENGSVDPLMEIQIEGEMYPFFSRDELTSQLYRKRAKFPDYEGFASVKMSGILDEKELERASILQVDTLASLAFEKVGSNWEPIQMPLQFQFSPNSRFIEYSLGEVLLLGNLENTRLKIGKLTANPGIQFSIQKGEKVQAYSSKKTGINLNEEVVDAILANEVLWVSTANGKIIQYQKTK